MMTWSSSSEWAHTMRNGAPNNLKSESQNKKKKKKNQKKFDASGNVSIATQLLKANKNLKSFSIPTTW